MQNLKGEFSGCWDQYIAMPRGLDSDWGDPDLC